MPSSDFFLPTGASAKVSSVTSPLRFSWGLSSGHCYLLSLASQIASRHRTFFLTCTLNGALSTIALVWFPPSLDLLLVLRFATGFFLAGIYPVGMKIAASWLQEGLGRALGYLVGELVLGTAFPHLLATTGSESNWHQVLWFVSVLAASGGLVICIDVADGTHLPKGSPFNRNAVRVIFRSPEFRASAFGYLGSGREPLPVRRPGKR